ncbi:MAG: transglycosylase domain-containing protein, partial [Bacteroidales bacterium]
MRTLFRWIRNLIFIFIISTIGITVIYRFIPVYITPLMVIRSVQQFGSGDKIVLHHTWVPLDKISPFLPQAVVASEDNLFMDHHGFDIKAIKKATEENKKRKRPRGASTISQQTAKNVFL